MCENTQLFPKRSILDILHGSKYTSVFQIEKNFSFQKTTFQVTWKDFNIIVHLTNAATNRVFDWD